MHCWVKPTLQVPSLAPLLLTNHIILILLCNPEPTAFLPFPSSLPSFFPCLRRLAAWKQSCMTAFGRPGLKVKQPVQGQQSVRANSSAAGGGGGSGDLWGRGGTEDSELLPPPDPSPASLLDRSLFAYAKELLTSPGQVGPFLPPALQGAAAATGGETTGDLGGAEVGTPIKGSRGASILPPSLPPFFLSPLLSHFPFLLSLPPSFPLIFLISPLPQLSPPSPPLSSCPHPSPPLQGAHGGPGAQSGWEWVSFSSSDPGVFAGCSRAGDRADLALHFL